MQYTIVTAGGSTYLKGTCTGLARRLRGDGAKADTIYRVLAGNAHLFDKAFYGHKATKQERARLRYLWKVSLSA